MCANTFDEGGRNMLYQLPKNEVRIGLRLPKELKDKIDQIAAENGYTTSALIRTMLYGAVYSMEHPDTIDAVKEVLKNVGEI